MAILEALAPPLSVSTTASGECPAPSARIKQLEQYNNKGQSGGFCLHLTTKLRHDDLVLASQCTALRLPFDLFNLVLSYGRKNHNDSKVILTLCCHDDGVRPSP